MIDSILLNGCILKIKKAEIKTIVKTFVFFVPLSEREDS